MVLPSGYDNSIRIEFVFRGGNYPNREMCDLLKRVLETVPPEVLEKSICVVDTKRITRYPTANWSQAIEVLGVEVDPWLICGGEIATRSAAGIP